jgi:hypothetical protein
MLLPTYRWECEVTCSLHGDASSGRHRYLRVLALHTTDVLSADFTKHGTARQGGQLEWTFLSRVQTAYDRGHGSYASGLPAAPPRLVQVVYAATARPRGRMNKPVILSRDLADDCHRLAAEAAQQGLPPPRVGLMYGRESSGLTNSEVGLAHRWGSHQLEHCLSGVS